ncbi:MAG: hypothetical protein WDN25_00795 [Acetobacteraceae bacterium]
MTGVASSLSRCAIASSTSMPPLRGIIHVQQHCIEQHCIERRFGIHRQRLLAVDRARDVLVPETPQPAAQHVTIVGIVVDDEQPRGVQRGRHGSLMTVCGIIAKL